MAQLFSWKRLGEKISSFACIESCFMETVFCRKCFKFSSLWAVCESVVDLRLLSCWKSQHSSQAINKWKILVNRCCEFYFGQVTFQSVSPHWAHTKPVQQQKRAPLPTTSAPASFVGLTLPPLLWYPNHSVLAQGISSFDCRWCEGQTNRGRVQRRNPDASLDVPLQLREWLDLSGVLILFGFAGISALPPCAFYSASVDREVLQWATPVCSREEAVGLLSAG